MLKILAETFFSATKSINTRTKCSANFREKFRVILFRSRRYCTHNRSNSSILSSFLLSQEQANKWESTNKEEIKKQRNSTWPTIKYTLIAFGSTLIWAGVYLIMELGKPTLDSDGNSITDEFSDLPIYKQYFHRTLSEIHYFIRMMKEPSREKLLPDPLVYPNYQPPYTLILELTDVMIHPEWTYKSGWRFKKRPGIDSFLQSLSRIFEIVVFTAEQGPFVFPIVEMLDRNSIISHKLVRDATHFVDGHHVKDLSKLNRNLNKVIHITLQVLNKLAGVIVVDWNPESVKFHPENLFHLPRWTGNDDDATLFDLAAFLSAIAQSEIEDVREVLRYYNQFDNPLKEFREKQKKLVEQKETQQSLYVPTVKRWSIFKEYS